MRPATEQSWSSAQYLMQHQQQQETSRPQTRGEWVGGGAGGRRGSGQQMCWTFNGNGAVERVLSPPCQVGIPQPLLQAPDERVYRLLPHVMAFEVLWRHARQCCHDCEVAALEACPEVLQRNLQLELRLFFQRGGLRGGVGIAG